MDKHTPKLFTEADLVYAFDGGYMSGHHDTVEGRFTDIHPRDFGTFHTEAVAEILDAENIRPSDIVAELLEALSDIEEIATSLEATVGQLHAKDEFEDDIHIHEKWAMDELMAKVAVARAALAKARGEQV